MQFILHKANSRGFADYGWLKANYTFSFSEYYNPQRIQFGALRVLNDDFISGGSGFGWHPHENMEIVTIPLSGALEHKDSEGNSGIIYNGDIQVMSAGTGIYHSEFNHLKNETSNTLQTWVLTKKKGVTPRYDQFSYKDLLKNNSFTQLVSPNPEDKGTWIYQDCWYHIGVFDSGINTHYNLKKWGNGVYFFIIEGLVDFSGTSLGNRDGAGIWECESINLEFLKKTTILSIEVPM